MTLRRGYGIVLRGAMFAIASVLIAQTAAAQKSFTVYHEPGNASRNGYAQAGAVVHYWFESCMGGVHMIAQVQSARSISRDYWYNRRTVNAGVAGYPDVIGLGTMVRGTVSGGAAPVEVSGDATTDSSPECSTQGIRVGNSVFPQGATDQQRAAVMQRLTFNPHGMGNLPPLKNDEVEGHYRALAQQERGNQQSPTASPRPPQETRVTEARPAPVVQPSASGQRQAQGQQATPQTATSAANGAVDRNEAIRRQNDAIVERNRRQSDSIMASLQAANERREIQTQQFTEVAGAVIGVVGGFLERRRAAADRRDAEEQRLQAQRDAQREEALADVRRYIAIHQPRADAGDAEEQLLVANAYIANAGKDPSFLALGRRYLQQSAAQNYLPAIIGLIANYAYTDRGNVDGFRLAQAVMRHPELSRDTYMSAAHTFAYMHMEGVGGFPRSGAEAVRWYRQVVACGEASQRYAPTVAHAREWIAIFDRAPSRAGVASPPVSCPWDAPADPAPGSTVDGSSAAAAGANTVRPSDVGYFDVSIFPILVSELPASGRSTPELQQRQIQTVAEQVRVAIHRVAKSRRLAYVFDSLDGTLLFLEDGGDPTSRMPSGDRQPNLTAEVAAEVRARRTP